MWSWWARKSEKGDEFLRSIESIECVTAEQKKLRGRIGALNEKLNWRLDRRETEIRILMWWASQVAVPCNDIEGAKELLAEAQSTFQNALQVANRNLYLKALLIGVLLVVLVSAGAVLLAEWATLLTQDDVRIIIPLFAFAGMGSVTSVLTRIRDIDFKDEGNKSFVRYMAVAKPLVAISFASVVYVILKYRIVSLGILPDDGAGREAVFLIAAFLSGFSERFATDILARAIPGHSKHMSA